MFSRCLLFCFVVATAVATRGLRQEGSSLAFEDSARELKLKNTGKGNHNDEIADLELNERRETEAYADHDSVDDVENELEDGNETPALVVPEFCKVIHQHWWDQRSDFENTYPYTNPKMRAYCAQFSKENAEDPSTWHPDDCYKATSGVDASMVICTIEGHGHPTKCVPTNCAHLNQDKCQFNYTGGICQWFTFVPTPGDPSRNRGHGCYPSPCNIGGQSYNSQSYCNTNPEFKDFNLHYEPPVTCAWCGMYAMGCQNVDPFPKSGCAKIGNNEINAIAKNNSAHGVKEGSILHISKFSSHYSTATICNNPDLVLQTGKTSECIYGQVGCGDEQLAAGFEYKYKFNANAKHRRLLH